MITHHCSECGEEVEEFCAAHPRARVDSVKSHASGPSGRNVNPRRKISAPPEAWRLMDRAAERAIESWSEWARGKLALAVADELGLEPEEMIALFDRSGL